MNQARVLALSQAELTLTLALTPTFNYGIQPPALNSNPNPNSSSNSNSDTKETQLPVIPWFANLSTTDPWTPPAYAAGDAGFDLGFVNKLVAQHNPPGDDVLPLD